MIAKGVSIIILTRNGVCHMERLLATFFRKNKYSPVEVIILELRVN
jgi:hypothetical protein